MNRDDVCVRQGVMMYSLLWYFLSQEVRLWCTTNGQSKKLLGSARLSIEQPWSSKLVLPMALALALTIMPTRIHQMAQHNLLCVQRDLDPAYVIRPKPCRRRRMMMMEFS